ncbi:MAG: CpaF family protein [Gemmatimonadetes bacterium]|nr:CpaF family protein [Gemmatimonadota bacterium]NIO31898.1 CpaF family protein [Gemmatimonadota bacterium]
MPLRPRVALFGLSSESRSAKADGRGGMSAAELDSINALKLKLHRQLIEHLDIAALEQLGDEQKIAAEIRTAVVELLQQDSIPLSRAEREDVIEGILYEVTGLGPIEPLFRDPQISDILVNGPKQVYVERQGMLSRVPMIEFRDYAHLMAVIDRIVSRIGRRVDESSPMVDARLPDGSRVNVIIPPLSLEGPVLSIRRFGREPLVMEDLLQNETLNEPMAYLLEGCVKARLNVLISGGTGAGKTTLLNCLSRFIPESERLITIEDAAELQLQQSHVVRLETRPPNAEGTAEVVQRDLVKNALRMRPDRIIIGEVRGGEALDMLQAMNTGHEGSLTTIHANSPRDALSRLETMILMAGTNLPPRAMREQMASALDVVIQVARLSDGSRKVASISEVVAMEGEIVTMQEIFTYNRRGITSEGKVVGQFVASGARPQFTDKLEVSGIRLPSEMFV